MTSEDQHRDTYQIDTLEADREYNYDTLDRLIEAELVDSPDWDPVATQTSSWSSLDDLGNWLTHSDRGATAINRTFDKANRMNDWGIVNTATLHNAAGNQVKLPNVAGTQLYNVVYDSLNRLRELRNTANTSTVALFDYDALGRRILFYDNKTPEFSRWYYYDGVNEILEASDDGSDILRWYVHGLSYIDERLMMHAKYDLTGTNVIGTFYYYAVNRVYDVRYLKLEMCGEGTIDKRSWDARVAPPINRRPAARPGKPARDYRRQLVPCSSFELKDSFGSSSPWRLRGWGPFLGLPRF